MIPSAVPVCMMRICTVQVKAVLVKAVPVKATLTEAIITCTISGRAAPGRATVFAMAFYATAIGGTGDIAVSRAGVPVTAAVAEGMLPQKTRLSREQAYLSLFS